MVDPDVVSSVESDGVATPDVLGVQISEVDVLNNDIAGTTSQSEALACDGTTVSDTNDTFVTAQVYGRPRSVVVGAIHPRVGRVASIPNPKLTGGCTTRTDSSAGVRAALLAGLTFRVAEVEGLVEHDDAGGVVGEP